jgi:hypothetical protein
MAILLQHSGRSFEGNSLFIEIVPHECTISDEECTISYDMPPVLCHDAEQNPRSREFRAMSEKEDIRHWRARAVECRTMRMQTKSLKARQRLLELAQSFEKMADSAEDRLKAPLTASFPTPLA